MPIVSNCYISDSGKWVLLGTGETDGVKSGKSGKGGHAEVQAYNTAREFLKKKKITPLYYLLVQNEFPCDGCLDNFKKWSNAMSFVFLVSDYEPTKLYHHDNGFKNSPVILPCLIYFYKQEVKYHTAPTTFPPVLTAWPK